MLIKQYITQKVETDSKEFVEPTQTVYFFERFIRRSIRIVPVYTTWNKEEYNKEEEIYRFNITCVYNCWEHKLEFFSIDKNNLEQLYYRTNGENDLSKFVKSWIDGYFDARTEEEFNKDLTNLLEITGKQFQ